MIKVTAIKPVSTFDSLGCGVNFISSKFSNSVNAAREYFFKKYDSPLNRDDDHVYFYQIQKFNVKKAIVKGKAKTKTSQGNPVAKRKIVTEGNTVLKVYRFRKDNIASAKQHSRHFEVVIKL